MLHRLANIIKKMKGISCYLLATLAIIVVLNCRLTVQQTDPARIFLPDENITCIEQEFNRTNTDPLCAIIEPELALLYQISSAEAVVDAIKSRLEQDSQDTPDDSSGSLARKKRAVASEPMLGQGINLFDIFCQKSCGQTFFEVWKSCSSFDELRNVADLLTSLCSTSNGRPCYMDYNQLISATDDTYDCYDEAPVQFGNCAVDCRTTLLLDVKTYGCCLNVFYNYIDAVEPDNGINEEVDRIFNECRVRRPAVCSTAPNMPFSTTASPSTVSSNPQVNDNDKESGDPQQNQRGMRNGSSRPIAVAAVLLLLNSLTAVFIQQL